MQYFVKIREEYKEGNTICLKMYQVKHKNKLPIISSVQVMLSSGSYHHCSRCFYSSGCNYECRWLEYSISVRRFIEREYGSDIEEYCLTPLEISTV